MENLFNIIAITTQVSLTVWGVFAYIYFTYHTLRLARKGKVLPAMLSLQVAILGLVTAVIQIF